MRRRLALGVLLLAALSLAVTTSAGKPAKPPQGTPVTVVSADLAGDRIQSDGGIYVNGVDGVTALIVPLGNLQLKTGTARTFWLDFGACAVGPCDPPFPEPQGRQGYMTTSCDTPLPSMDIDASQECNLNVHFTDNQLGWFIRFGEVGISDTATVTRLSDTRWTIEARENRIALLQSYPLKGRVTWTDHGQFFMPVGLTVTLLP